ncbi:unnamed protein product [Rhizoctonia solani]|uniref:Uncharacterized protein n=1 Tax=Rhizoctonia solani TaxID=456999 RepID=A0A8H3D441_9AGAM|nr:unnamed protein product [Rhizoctonia solani]
MPIQSKPCQPCHTGNRRADTISSSSAYTSSDNSLGRVQQSKDLTGSRNRSATVSGYSYPPASPPGDIESTKSSPRTSVPSPAPSSSGSSSSGKSVRWWDDPDEQGRISPGHSVGSPKGPCKPVLKYRKLHLANMPSLFDENTPIVTASAAIDSVLCDLVNCIKNFKCPSELDFTANTESLMVLAKVEKNKPFIGQLRKLGKLANKLAEVPTHDNTRLMDRHKATSTTIGRALTRMQDVQIKLYVKTRICVESFVYPVELDFPEDSKGGLVLLKTEKNKPFIDQLQNLSLLRGRLNNIPEHDDEQLKRKRWDICVVIKGNLDKMKEHQVRLHYRQLTKAYQERHIWR